MLRIWSIVLGLALCALAVSCAQMASVYAASEAAKGAVVAAQGAEKVAQNVAVAATQTAGAQVAQAQATANGAMQSVGVNPASINPLQILPAIGVRGTEIISTPGATIIYLNGQKYVIANRWFIQHQREEAAKARGK